MHGKDLEIFNQMPFLFWVKDAGGRYVWGNRVINRLAGEDVTGKTDADLVWAADAEGLREADRRVWETGEPSFVHEFVAKSSSGQVTLNVCKFMGDFEGERHVFGVSFIIEDGS